MGLRGQLGIFHDGHLIIILGCAVAAAATAAAQAAAAVSRRPACSTTAAKSAAPAKWRHWQGSEKPKGAKGSKGHAKGQRQKAPVKCRQRCGKLKSRGHLAAYELALQDEDWVV